VYRAPVRFLSFKLCDASYKLLQCFPPFVVPVVLHYVVNHSKVYLKISYSFCILDIFQNPKMSILQKVNRLLFCVFYEFIIFIILTLIKNHTIYGARAKRCNILNIYRRVKYRFILAKVQVVLDIFPKNPCRDKNGGFFQLFPTMHLEKFCILDKNYLSAQINRGFTSYGNK
jgi:hypothetical protein